MPLPHGDAAGLGIEGARCGRGLDEFDKPRWRLSRFALPRRGDPGVLIPRRVDAGERDDLPGADKLAVLVHVATANVNTRSDTRTVLDLAPLRVAEQVV